MQNEKLDDSATMTLFSDLKNNSKLSLWRFFNDKQQKYTVNILGKVNYEHYGLRLIDTTLGEDKTKSS